MTKTILFGLLLFAVSTAVFGQETTFPGYFAENEVPLYGETISDTITNRGTMPASFYINYIAKDSLGIANESEKKLIFSDSALIYWVLNHGTSPDPDERLVQYVTAIRDITKKPRNFRNYLNIAIPGIFDNVDSGCAKINTITGGFASFKHKQCGQYRDWAMACLYYMYLNRLDTAACHPSKYRSTDIEGSHSIFEILYKNTWGFVDVDPGTAGFMFRNGSVYYSTQELVDNPNRITLSELYNPKNSDGSLVDPFNPGTDLLALYRSYFMNKTVLIQSTIDIVATYLPITGYSVSGGIMLPPQGSLVFSYTNQSLPVNTFTPGIQSIVDSAIMLFDAGDMDVLADFLADHFSEYGITSSNAHDVLQYNGFNLFHKQWSPLYEQDGISVPTLQYHITTDDNSLVIGRDVGGPFVVTGVTTNNPLTINGSTYNHGFSLSLWDATNTGGPAFIAENSVNYFTSGVIPPYTHCIVEVAFNPGYIDWWNGYSIDQLGQNDTLTLARTQNVQTFNGVHTSLGHNEVVLDDMFTVYPNPTNGTLFLKTSSTNSPIVVYDYLGNEIAKYDSDMTRIHINNPGIYLIWNGLKTRQVIVR